ncbi:MAG: DUF3048 domain-containing protein [Oscillospiraceae bacterium]
MKKISCLLLSLCICLGMLAGCGDKPANSESSRADSAVSPSSEAPKKQAVNPLTGKPLVSESAQGKRPVSVMVSNIKQALPQSGLSSADICYEALAEGGITRIMAVFSDYTQLPKTGPVRSARDYYLQLAPAGYHLRQFRHQLYCSGYDPSKNVDNIDGMYYSALTFAQDQQRPPPVDASTAYIDAEGLQKAIDKAKIDTDQATALQPVFKFRDYEEEPVQPQQMVANRVSVGFSYYNTSEFTYNSGKYFKSQFGEAQIDENTGSQISFENVVVLFAGTSNVQNSVLLQMDLNGGSGYYISAGGAEEINWKKGKYETQ